MEAYFINGDIEIIGPCVKVHQHVRHEKHIYWWQPATDDIMFEVKCSGYYRDTGEMKPIIRGETETYGKNNNLWWANVLTILVIVGYVGGFIWAIFIKGV